MDVYKGDAKFIIDYFQMTSSDFVIPEYQREYAWNAENVNQLFLDLRYGLSRIKISDTESKKKRKNQSSLDVLYNGIEMQKEIRTTTHQAVTISTI